MCQAFLPLLKKDGRIVNVSSVGSSLERYSDGIKQQFRDPNLTLQDLEGMMEKYQVYIVRVPDGFGSWLMINRAVSTKALKYRTVGLVKHTVSAKHARTHSRPYSLARTQDLLSTLVALDGCQRIWVNLSVRHLKHPVSIAPYLNYIQTRKFNQHCEQWMEQRYRFVLGSRI